MVKLSDRLRKLADEVKPGETAADIGTDHGLLPIFLCENAIAAKVILCDINPGPLEKARENIKIHGASAITDLRLGNGLGPLAWGEADAIIIAGMGGLLISEILGNEDEKAKSSARLVLQPRNAADKLREWLFANGYSIKKESLVREGKYICEIITAVPATERQRGRQYHKELDLEISPLLFESRDELLIPFIEKKIRVEENIMKQIEEGSGMGNHGRIQIARERLAALTELLEKARELNEH